MGGEKAILKSPGRLTFFCVACVSIGVIVGLVASGSFSGNEVVEASTFRRRLNAASEESRSESQLDLEAPRGSFSGDDVMEASTFRRTLLASVGVSIDAYSHPSPPPYQLPVVNVNLKTARKDAVKSDSAEYDAQSHEFHRVCMHDTNNTPTDPAYADWTSDGKAASKLHDMKGAELLDPIGKFREGSMEVKVYNATYQISLVDFDGHKPIALILTENNEIEQEAKDMCVNPIIDIVAQGVMSETSASCEERLLEESALVQAEFKNCQKLVKTTLDKKNDLTSWQGKTFSLKSDGAQVERLYQDRKRLGKIYDDFFDTWLSTHNDGLAACAYSTNYMSFFEELSDGYLKNLDEEKKDITEHCTNIPTMQSFDVTKANVNEVQGVGARLGGAQDLDSNNPCYDAVEAISGIQMQAKSTHSKRAQCLEFYCESIHDTHLPAARQNAVTAKASYDNADEAFNTAWTKYTQDQESYQTYYDAVVENTDLVESARDLAEGSMNATKALADALVETAKCVPSSICCQAPEVIPEICHRNANGTVATFVPASGDFSVDHLKNQTQ